MSKPQTRCVFCGGVPATKGHIWPEWFDRYLPAKASHHLEAVGEVLTFEYKGDGPKRRNIVRQGHAGSRKPRNTCKRCNGGWMSRLEQANVPVLSSLMLGTPTLITPIDQWLLASLACLITIRLEFADTEMQGVPVEDRSTLMNTGGPPFDTWRIWIAGYSGDHPEDHWSRHFGMQIVSSVDHVSRPHKCNAQITTLVLGKLCIHAVSSSAMPVPRGYDGISLSEIWPPNHMTIDSRLLPPLNDAEVVYLHESIPASMKTVREQMSDIRK
jgi:hypothetical protein